LSLLISVKVDPRESGYWEEIDTSIGVGPNVRPMNEHYQPAAGAALSVAADSTVENAAILPDASIGNAL